MPTVPAQKEGEDNSEYEDRVHREYNDISGISGIFKSFSDAPGGFKEELEEINYGVGAEYVYNDKFALRAGYHHESQSKGNRKYFTVGAGFKMNVFSLDASLCGSHRQEQSARPDPALYAGVRYGRIERPVQAIGNKHINNFNHKYKIMNIRVGFGYDVHKLVENRDLWLGGIKIDYELGLLGHSDADVLIHAICDALLGAANMRDIGYHFPDTAAETLNVDSKILLKKTMDLIATKGYTLGNIDATVCAERPKLNPHIPAMKECLAKVMGVEEDQISIKATTTEKLGFTGRMEGISAYATVLIEKA